MKELKNSESGYALLLVYAMAATVAIMLYSEMPRIAFEAQREKEQLLIDRGEQYSRAVQLYVRRYSRFPADVKSLENTQNIRFLRKQYVDPMTGKSEWREVHVGPGGVFVDSLVHGKKKADQNAPQTFITELQQIGGNVANQNEGVNLATRRRASDQPGAPGSLGGVVGGVDSNGQPLPPQGIAGTPGAANSAAPISGPVMVLPDGRIVAASPTGAYTPGQQGIAGQGIAGQPGLPPGVQPPNGIGVQPGVQPGFQNQPGFLNQPGFQNQPNGPPAGAANMINQILTTPRPQPGSDQLVGTPNAQNGNFGGAASPAATSGFSNTGTGSNTGTSAGQGMGGTIVGGGFAGVASKREREGIKVYNERTAYNEWEFVYDMTKDPTRGGGAAMQSGQQQLQQQQQQQQQPQPQMQQPNPGSGLR